MVIRTCECCNFSTSRKSVYDNHIKSKKHLLKETTQNTSVKRFDCIKCHKTYFSSSGLYFHNKKCIGNHDKTISTHIIASENIFNDMPPSNVVFTAEMFQKLLESNEKLHNEIQEIKRNQEKTAENPASVNITNNITNNNYNDIRIFLNSKCDKAMNIDTFLDTMEMNRSDMMEMEKNQFYCEGAAKIVKKYLQTLSIENRPVHCVNKIPDQPAMFFVRDDDTWKEECHAIIHFQTHTMDDFEDESKEMKLNRFLYNFKNKLYDNYMKLCSSDKKLEIIKCKMTNGGNSKDRLDILHELKPMLVIDAGDDSSN
jgi:hypothetical protein